MTFCSAWVLLGRACNGEFLTLVTRRNGLQIHRNGSSAIDIVSLKP